MISAQGGALDADADIGRERLLQQSSKI